MHSYPHSPQSLCSLALYTSVFWTKTFGKSVRYEMCNDDSVHHHYHVNLVSRLSQQNAIKFDHQHCLFDESTDGYVFSFLFLVFLSCRYVFVHFLLCFVLLLPSFAIAIFIIIVFGPYTLFALYTYFMLLLLALTSFHSTFGSFFPRSPSPSPSFSFFYSSFLFKFVCVCVCVYTAPFSHCTH